MTHITIDPEFETLILPLTDDEYRQLEANVIAEGCRDSLVTWRGLLLDGHHRHRICQEHGITFRVVSVDGMETREEAIDWIICNQLGRRNLTREYVSYLRGRRYLQEKKNIGVPSGKRIEKGDTLSSFSKTADELGEEYNVSDRTIKRDANYATALDALADLTGDDTRRAILRRDVRVTRADTLRLAENAKDEPEKVKRVMELVLEGQAVKEAWRQARQAIILAQPPAKLPSQATLYHGDFAQVAQELEPDSIDVIITDPPYPKEYLYLYGVLAEQAARLLKPGGSLLAMAGQSYLPDVLNLMTPYLTYLWTIAYLTPGGQSAQLWQRKVNTFWKPVLWFVKGEYEGAWVGDVVKSAVNDNDKRFHGWGQSESGMADLVRRFSKPDDLILDPFCGGGTTGVVALALGRQFIGIDIEEEVIKTTRYRIANGK